MLVAASLDAHDFLCKYVEMLKYIEDHSRLVTGIL